MNDDKIAQWAFLQYGQRLYLADWAERHFHDPGESSSPGGELVVFPVAFRYIEILNPVWTADPAKGGTIAGGDFHRVAMMLLGLPGDHLLMLPSGGFGVELVDMLDPVAKENVETLVENARGASSDRVSALATPSDAERRAFAHPADGQRGKRVRS